jgi:hypothetical protein
MATRTPPPRSLFIDARAPAAGVVASRGFLIREQYTGRDRRARERELDGLLARREMARAKIAGVGTRSPYVLAGRR